MLEKNGYQIKVLNLVDMAHSDTYNPFLYLHEASDVYKMIDYLIANRNPPNSRHSDPFWDHAVQVLLSSICFYLKEACNPEDQTLANVLKVLRCAEGREDEDYKSALDIMFEDLEEQNPESVAVKQYKIFKSCGGGKTASTATLSSVMKIKTSFSASR